MINLKDLFLNRFDEIRHQLEYECFNMEDHTNAEKYLNEMQAIREIREKLR